MKQLRIDLGSAYTKLAFRADWNETADLLRDGDEPSGGFCIPSTVARIGDVNDARWLMAVPNLNRNR